MKKLTRRAGALAALCLAVLLAVPVALFAAREEVHSESFVQFRGVRHNDLTAAIETSMGTIRVVLYSRYAPLAVDNFTTLAAEGYYDGTSFHRVIEDFIVQGGDATGTGTGGQSRWGTPFKTEAREGLRHYSGALCMATAGGAKDTHGSQFYFVASPQDNITGQAIEAMREAGVNEYVIDMYNAAGGLPYLDYTDTVFGQIYEGMDVLDAIAAVATDKNDRPEEDVKILSITIERYIDEEAQAAEEEEAARREEEARIAAEAENNGEEGDGEPPGDNGEGGEE